MSETLYTIEVGVNGKPRTGQVPARLSLVDWLQGRAAAHRHARRLRARHLRRLLGDARRRAGALLPHVRGSGERPPRDHSRGARGPDGHLSVLQDSFCETHGLQCGYCTPGMLIAAQALLDSNPNPTEEQIRDAIGGNLCRCTGYQQIVEAVQLAATRMKTK